MIDRYFPCQRVRERIRSCGCGELLDEFAERLHRRGYASATIRGGVWAVEHFATWLNGQKLKLHDATKDHVRSFLGDHLPVCRCPPPAPVGMYQVRPAINHLARMLRDRRAGSDGASAPPTPVDTELRQFRDHLRRVCGLADSTCDGRVRFTREFLQARYRDGALHLDALKPGEVMAFVAGYAERCRRGTAQVAASSLRSFLRYLQFHGRCAETLIAAVPRIPNWRLSHVPKTMAEEQLQAFLESFDRTTSTGRRDYAMALCQVVLGLRVSEVAALLLNDVAWHCGILRIEDGKGRKSRELPLTKRVGEALAEYIRWGRPPTECRSVFIRHRAPRGAVSVSLVRGAMRLAFARAPGCERWKGTHVLRHTAATNLLQRGATLKEIADVLGHSCVETSTIYAKVNLPSLQAVAMPWPEVQQ
ncbi:MAG: integrase [Planctomycetes bacterium]|nr:integrase [Planctomycetota bacterium]